MEKSPVKYFEYGISLDGEPSSNTGYCKLKKKITISENDLQKEKVELKITRIERDAVSLQHTHLLWISQHFSKMSLKVFQNFQKNVHEITSVFSQNLCNILQNFLKVFFFINLIIFFHFFYNFFQIFLYFPLNISKNSSKAKFWN